MSPDRPTAAAGSASDGPRVDVYVVSDGLVERAAALELAEVGLRVRFAAPPVDQAEPPAELAAPGRAGAVHDPDGDIETFLAQLSAPLQDGAEGWPAAEPVKTAPGTDLLPGAAGQWIAVPEPNVLGIPAVPLSQGVIDLVGRSGAMRAFLDRVRPLLTIGKTTELGALVRSRLGEKIATGLLEPFVHERFGASPDVVEVAVAAPGLNEALTRAGSLSAAVLAMSDRTAARETVVAPAGGFAGACAAADERLALYGATRAEQRITTIARHAGETAHDDGVPMSDAAPWRITEAGDAPDGSGSAPVVVDARVLLGDPETLTALGVSSAVQELHPTRERVAAQVRIVDPGIEGVSAESRTTSALRVVTPRDGARWTVRVMPTEDGVMAQIVGPAQERTTHTAGGRGESWEALAERTIEDVLWLAGFAADGPMSVTSVPAPFVSLAERDAARERSARVLDADPALLPVGAALHGGDLGAAIRDARETAIGVRRRLTGIAD